MSVGPPDNPGRLLRRAIAQKCVAMPGVFNAGVARLVKRTVSTPFTSAAPDWPTGDGRRAGHRTARIGRGRAAGGVRRHGRATSPRWWMRTPGLAGQRTRAGGGAAGARGAGGAAHRGPGLSQALRPPRRQGAGAGAGDGPQDSRRPARRGEDFLIVARTDARGVEDFDAAVERAASISMPARTTIFPETCDGRRISSLRQSSPCAVDGEHDRIRPRTAAQRPATRIDGLPDGDLPDDRVPGSDEGGGEVPG